MQKVYSMKQKAASIAAACLSLSCVSCAAVAQTYNGSPANYRSLLDTLKAGDVLQLEAGTYDQGLPLRGLNGQENNVITITGPESGNAAVIVGRSCCNTVQLGNSSYITVKNLTLDGLNIPYVDAVNTDDVTHNITVENLLIINHGGSDGPDTDHQLTVGISTKAPAWDWVIRRNTIIGAGTGMYLGNSDGNEPFVRGLIEYNLILDTLGYNIEIKHQNPRPTNIGLPTGDNATIIRHNVFSKANNASMSGYWARPNLLVGHFPTSGDGINDHYEIYGNFFYQNPSEALFQGEGNVALYNNVFLNDSNLAISIQPHNDVPKTISIFQNTVVANGKGISVSGPDTNYTQMVKANAVFASPALSMPSVVLQSDNVTDTYDNAVNYLVDPFAANGSPDLFPVTGMLSGAAVDTASFRVYTDWNIDFNGDTRDGTFRGAYSGEGTNPGWTLAREMKPDVSVDVTLPPSPIPDQPPPGDSGSTTDTTTNTGSSASGQNSGGGANGVVELLLLTLFGFILPRLKKSTSRSRTSA